MLFWFVDGSKVGKIIYPASTMLAPGTVAPPESRASSGFQFLFRMVLNFGPGPERHQDGAKKKRPGVTRTASAPPGKHLRNPGGKDREDRT